MKVIRRLKKILSSWPLGLIGVVTIVVGLPGMVMEDLPVWANSWSPTALSLIDFQQIGSHILAVHVTAVVITGGEPYRSWACRLHRSLRLLGWVRIRYSWESLPEPVKENDIWDGMMRPTGEISQADWTTRLMLKGKLDSIPFQIGNTQNMIAYRIEVPNGWGLDFLADQDIRWVRVSNGDQRWQRYATYRQAQHRADHGPWLIQVRVVDWSTRRGGCVDAAKALRSSEN